MKGKYDAASVWFWSHTCTGRVYNLSANKPVGLYRIAAVWDSVEKGSKKTTFRWCIKAFPITGKAFMSSPAKADVFFVGIQNVDDRVGGQVADAFAKKPFGAEQRGADVQMRQR